MADMANNKASDRRTGRMRFFRRSLIALGVAATLPTLLFAAIAIFYFLRTERTQVETATLGRSFNVVTLSDAALRGDLGALNVLAASSYFETENWRVFYPRVRRILKANPQWTTIRLFDLEKGEEVFDLRRPFGEPRPATLPDPGAAELLLGSSGQVIGDIRQEASEPLVYLYVPVRREERMRYVLAAAIRPQVFQDILTAQVPAGSVAALVDRNGNFLARTLDYSHFVGKPATRYVREAMSSGKQGFYAGVTYEGLKNYSAFYTSAWSGWSAHVAVASSLIDASISWSFLVAAIAGLGAALLAGVLVMLVVRDMAERRNAEEALRQSQKMEAVGKLTGGIAHDFNNLLTAIIGNLDMIRTRVEGNERLRRLSDNALEAARRGAKITAQLLAFSRNQRMQLKPVDLRALFDGMSGLLRQSIGPAVEAEVEISPEARFVLSDANQLELAVLNLAVNARDAMPHGGKLRISSHPATELDVQDLPKRPYVELRVMDTGTGMSEDVLARAMEPFFTTKQVGHGTGLGLSQVYGIASESGGSLSIESEVGRGTTVRMVLPAASEPEVTQPALARDDNSPTIPAAGNRSEAAILVVDDDRHVRRFVCESLGNLGYRVVETATGAAALEAMRGRRFDLLVADYAMPGMNGIEVARAAQQQHPGIPVLIISGYAESAAVEAVLGTGRLLKKPFDVAELATAVKELLQPQ